MAVNTLILVVDDEPDVLRLLQIFLTSKGYLVMTAGSADDAVRTFQESPRRPDLVITDVVMPGTSGPMLAERLIAIAPDQKILFMSGYDDRQVVRRYVLDRGHRLLAKPFKMKILEEAIEATLHGAKA